VEFFDGLSSFLCVVFQVDFFDKKFIGEEYAWFVNFYPLTKVLTTGQEVSNCVRCPWDVFKGVVEVGEEFEPTGLTARYFLWLTEVL
jgi:hypothetical protein